MTLFNGYIFYLGAFGLVLTGLYIVMVKRNLVKVIIGLSLMETGVNLFIVSTGYVRSGTAPIFSGPAIRASAMVDPVPQALVLTSIVIGVAVLALALSLAVRVHRHFGTLDLRKIKEQRW
jgi:multicomponent Na+:H+ antiporter subunit C